MAQNHNPTDKSGPIGAATGEFQGADTDDPSSQAAGAATCDIPPAAAKPTLTPDARPAPGGGTVDFQPGITASPEVGGTIDLPPGATAAPIGVGTIDFPTGATAAPAGGGTIDLPPPSAPPGHSPTLLPPGGGATCDIGPRVHSDSTDRATNVRSVGGATQQTPFDPSSTATPQQRAGRYIFKKFHAKGGMGEVWLAEDSDIGRPVALKRILKGRQNQQMSFIQEARVTGQLEHPGVIPVHELSLDENEQPYYVMKFVHGKTLKDVIADFHKGPLDAGTSREVEWLRLLNIFLDLCQTIAYAHSRGVIHRDIKPDNVMVGAYGETLVLDWGLAKVVGEPESADPFAAMQMRDDDTLQTMAGTVKGTPYFFAPEVAAGKVDEVDQVSDVYLLGGTLYNMITNHTPRTGKKISQLLDDAINVPPVPPRTLDPTVPKPLDAICRKALAHQKAGRYQTAAALAADVEAYIAGEPVTAYKETPLERAWRWAKKHRTLLSRTAMAVVLLGVISAAGWLLYDADQRAKEEIAAEKARGEEEVRKQELETKIAQAKADKLKREEDARQQIKNFNAAAEEARFYAASADPVAENAPTLDAANAEKKAKEALDIAAQWGPNLEALPLEDQRPGLRKDLYELLLEVAQLKSRRFTDEQVKAVQTTLERAAGFQPPTQSYYRLRARALGFLGQQEQAAADKKQADDPKTPSTAMDLYLLGEQSRIDSLSQVKDDVTLGKQAGLKGLLARRETLAKAIEFYRQALRVDPNHYWSHFQLATCYSGLGSYVEAAEALGARIALRPKSPWGYSARGLALAHTKNRAADAVADLNYALKLDSEFRPARLHRAVFYADQKEYKEAEVDFQAVLAPPAAKRLSEAAFSRGQMYMDRAMYAEALADFKEIVARPRPIHAVYLHLARIYLVQEKPNEALDNLSLFLARSNDFDRKSPRAHEQRGRELRLLAGEFASAPKRREAIYLLARAQLQKAVQLGGDNASLYGELGAIEAKLAELQPNPKEAAKRIQQAIKAYTLGIDRTPKDEELLVKRAWAYINSNQNDEAKDDFDAVVELNPGHAEAHAGLGYAEAMLKEPTSAVRHANLAVLHGAGDYLVLHNVACIYGVLSGADKALAQDYQNITLDYLTRAVDLWKKGNQEGPNEINLIQIENETTFPPALRARREFKKLMKENQEK